MGAVLPLLALRAFVETARHGSLTRAAVSMGVTPGAVSQQLRLLQERTGVDLFQRSSHGMRLTAAGEQVYPGLRQAFEQIAASLAQLEAINARQTLTVSTEPSFAAAWLVPRLGQFSARHPQVEVRVEASAQLADLRRERIDVAIRHGLGDYPGLDVQALMAPPLIPVASPRLLAEGPALCEAADCLAYPLLQEAERRDWRLWLQAMGVADDPRMDRGPAFADDLLLLRAAEAGQGIALVRDIHARAEIASGRLALALDSPWPSRFAYYAVSLPGAAQRAPLSQFLAWLREQAATEA
ncbi:LysR substrate-binding domain-containing protein [Pseudomonas paraeruginosa]|uniref:LysR substrate-binding domain-containing protein n=1 Tax=Pseudomonas aeruginosa group TaxID=136841 RepID=UPI00053EC4F0|nr:MULTISPECIES: LysR substrate-binding domain-containing protein [Pseudomonas aeruginosa group]KAB0744871.1 LysR family transcriptional regulator [Pseudomonas aeruginosa]MBG4066134.1 LysR family transcriptional regulator [Pseudomonas aeruginosa]MBG5599547.1 LysR family transcriptional regulator [Pseudomonas aeruginosa]MBH3671180.1 LysR family transcriptional regulator [Pseudomonas aeruginosa]MBH9432844.1 LysR family transcriptional regulator [Pseudomonas aeruginosa]